MMQEKRNIWFSGILALLIVASGFYLQQTLSRKSKPPTWVLEEPLEKIDAETSELVTLSRTEWKNLGENLGRFKNPKTGQYTMAEPIRCPHCLEWIPKPQLPKAPKLNTDDLRNAPMPQEVATYQAELADIWSTFKCPKCGELYGPYQSF